ncbi:MAG: hypothetical protein J1E03_04655 [Acetatifactor sp.]|nr:hypothetical protein [Acetatifactor sp.]
MATNKSNYDYEEIIEHFGKDKIISRYGAIESLMESFIQKCNYQDKVKIADSVLNQAIIDYFMDIHRLKNFHHIDKINYVKIHAYSAYWILRRKPIQIIQDDDEDTELAFVNENFVATYLMQFLRGEYKGVLIRKEDRLTYNDFTDNLHYVLRYRTITAQTLETILESYFAGQVFERSIGISD